MSLVDWAAIPVWKDEPGYVRHLQRSFSGTLKHPVITEQGRAFLADLLMRLSDSQIRDPFEVSRVHLTLRDPGDVHSGFATINE